jgi:hypothetical protein
LAITPLENVTFVIDIITSTSIAAPAVVIPVQTFLEASTTIFAAQSAATIGQQQQQSKQQYEPQQQLQQQQQQPQ